MKGKHYNTITSFVPYKSIITYPHNKIFTIFINYLLPPTYPTYYILLWLHTYYLLPNPHLINKLPNLPNLLLLLL
jgi:hypothetical protein